MIKTSEAIQIIEKNLKLEAKAVEDDFTFHAEKDETGTTLRDGKGRIFDTDQLGLEDMWEIRRRENVA
jgi:hypothetical protein